MKAESNLVEKSVPVLFYSHKELITAIEYMQSILDEWNMHFSKADFLSTSETELIKQYYEILNKELLELNEILNKFKTLIEELKTEDELQILIEMRKNLYARLRICFSQFSALITCLNWQAPSIKSSSNTRIGIEKYPVRADWNDYKRDRSGDTFFCEAMVENNIIKTKNTGVTPVLNIFNGGMAAFTAIIYFLINERIVKEKVLISSQIYVESRLLLKEFFREQIELFDYNDTSSIVENILATKPSAVFLEPMSNTNNLRLFDVPAIVKEVANNYKEDIYFIIDVTCLLGFENIFDDYQIPENIKIILHGSMMKSSQLGQERTNGGFVQTFNLGDNSKKILDYRTLSGTTMQDYASNALPFTTKELLQQRMKIIEENTVYLAEAMLNKDIDNELISEVVFPRLKTHPDYEFSKQVEFAGSFFNIKFIDEMNNDTFFELFTSLMIKIAKEKHSDVVHRASFGFNQTSIYYSVGWDEPENHYIRISPGNETPYEIEKIKDVLIQTFDEFKAKVPETLENSKKEVK